MPRPSGTFLQLDLAGAMHLGLWDIIFAFLFVDLFDNVGTLMGVCAQAGFVEGGKIPRVGRVLLADGIGTVVGSLTGTSTVTSYIESAAGVAAGARTGLSNLAVAALFLVALFFAPLAAAIPPFATAPALILVGGLMMRSMAEIAWPDFSEAFPGFVTAVAMPLTFSIATGLSFGVITYTVAKVAAGKLRQVSSVMWILTILFVVRDVYLAIG
jgi:AGZA family xanthine/uracil permease-like MFS transporter